MAEGGPGDQAGAAVSAVRANRVAALREGSARAQFRIPRSAIQAGAEAFRPGVGELAADPRRRGAGGRSDGDEVRADPQGARMPCRAAPKPCAGPAGPRQPPAPLLRRTS